MQESGKITVLYVDDELHNLNSFKANFRRDFNILTAQSGAEGLEILSELGDDIQIVLTDQKMPEMSGNEFLSILIDRYPKPIRVLITAYSDIETVIGAINEGKVFSYVSKPWNYNELKKTIQDAFETYQRRLEKDEEINHFVYKASHDIKGPLVSLKGIVSMAIDNLNNKDSLSQLLTLIDNSVGSIENTLDSILEYKNIDKSVLRDSIIDFNELIPEILVENKNVHEYNGLKIDTNINTSHNFINDKDVIHSILSQLIQNAIKYRKPNDVNSFLNIHIDINEKEAILSIEDNGVGMSERVLKNAFTLFFRGHKGVPGSGLGLYVVKKGTERIGGELTAKSILSEGSKFTLTIPNNKTNLLKRENIIAYTVV